MITADDGTVLTVPAQTAYQPSSVGPAIICAIEATTLPRVGAPRSQLDHCSARLWVPLLYHRLRDFPGAPRPPLARCSAPQWDPLLA